MQPCRAFDPRPSGPSSQRVALPLQPTPETTKAARTSRKTRAYAFYVVDYAHLDTQWRWNFPQTISEFLLKTLRVNFDYIDKYPHYVFNWTGSNRYRLMKEYYPDDYARLQQYAAKGNWYPARLLRRRGRRQPPQRRRTLSPVPLRQRILPQGSRQGQQ